MSEDLARELLDAAIAGGHASRAGDLTVAALTGDPIAPTTGDPSPA